MIKGFRDFLLRGNIIDLAVAFVIGAAFTALVKTFSDAFITPLINSLFSVLGVSKDGVGGSIGIPGGQELNFGIMIGALITFILTAAVVYFVFVVPMNTVKSRMAKTEKEAVITVEDLLAEIRDLIKADAAPGKDTDTKS